MFTDSENEMSLNFNVLKNKQNASMTFANYSVNESAGAELEIDSNEN